MCRRIHHRMTQMSPAELTAFSESLLGSRSAKRETYRHRRVKQARAWDAKGPLIESVDICRTKKRKCTLHSRTAV
jgi:hypothetical protein